MAGSALAGAPLAAAFGHFQKEGEDIFLLLEVQEPFPSLPGAARLAVLDGNIRVFQGKSTFGNLKFLNFLLCEVSAQFLMIFIQSGAVLMADPAQ